MGRYVVTYEDWSSGFPKRGKTSFGDPISFRAWFQEMSQQDGFRIRQSLLDGNPVDPRIVLGVAAANPSKSKHQVAQRRRIKKKRAKTDRKWEREERTGFLWPDLPRLGGKHPSKPKGKKTSARQRRASRPEKLARHNGWFDNVFGSKESGPPRVHLKDLTGYPGSWRLSGRDPSKFAEPFAAAGIEVKAGGKKGYKGGPSLIFRQGPLKAHHEYATGEIVSNLSGGRRVRTYVLVEDPRRGLAGDAVSVVTVPGPETRKFPDGQHVVDGVRGDPRDAVGLLTNHFSLLSQARRNPREGDVGIYPNKQHLMDDLVEGDLARVGKAGNERGVGLLGTLKNLGGGFWEAVPFYADQKPITFHVNQVVYSDRFRNRAHEGGGIVDRWQLVELTKNPSQSDVGFVYQVRAFVPASDYRLGFDDSGWHTMTYQAVGGSFDEHAEHIREQLEETEVSAVQAPPQRKKGGGKARSVVVPRLEWRSGLWSGTSDAFKKALVRVNRGARSNPRQSDVGRLYGFHYIKEWDGSMNRVTVYKKRADLADWLKHRIDAWANILYADGTMHTIPWAQFESMDQGRFDPNVTDGSGFRYAKKNPRQTDVWVVESRSPDQGQTWWYVLVDSRDGDTFDDEFDSWNEAQRVADLLNSDPDADVPERPQLPNPTKASSRRAKKRGGKEKFVTLQVGHPDWSRGWTEEIEVKATSVAAAKQKARDEGYIVRHAQDAGMMKREISRERKKARAAKGKGTLAGEMEALALELSTPSQRRFHDALREEHPRLKDRVAVLGGRRKAKKNPRQSDVGMYQDVLAHLRALQWVYTTTHWTSSGPNSYGDHLLLQRLYEGLDKPIDALGERMVAYFGPQSVDPGVINGRVQHFMKYDFHGVAEDPFYRLFHHEDSLQKHIRKAWKANQDSGNEFSLGIDDYLMGLANERDEAIYLLKQRLHGG